MKKLVLVFIGLLSVQLFAQGPGEPFNPMTANGAEGISFWSHTLLWQNPVNVVYNKVFFSDDLYLVNALDSSVQIFNGLPNNSIEEILLNSNQLDPYTKYYWRVVEYDSSNFTNGPVWYFRTMPHPSEFIHTEDFSSLSNNWQITNDGGTCVWEIHNAFKYTLPSTATASTTIKFSIPAVGTRLALSVQLKVYDVLGKEIATLVNEEKPAGNYEVEFNSVETLHVTSLPSGVYFYQLKTEDFIQTNKMILMK